MDRTTKTNCVQFGKRRFGLSFVSLSRKQRGHHIVCTRSMDCPLKLTEDKMQGIERFFRNCHPTPPPKVHVARSKKTRRMGQLSMSSQCSIVFCGRLVVYKTWFVTEWSVGGFLGCKRAEETNWRTLSDRERERVRGVEQKREHVIYDQGVGYLTSRQKRYDGSIVKKVLFLGNGWGVRVEGFRTFAPEAGCDAEGSEHSKHRRVFVPE